MRIGRRHSILGLASINCDSPTKNRGSKTAASSSTEDEDSSGRFHTPYFQSNNMENDYEDSKSCEEAAAYYGYGDCDNDKEATNKVVGDGDHDSKLSMKRLSSAGVAKYSSHHREMIRRGSLDGESSHSRGSNGSMNIIKRRRSREIDRCPSIASKSDKQKRLQKAANERVKGLSKNHAHNEIRNPASVKRIDRAPARPQRRNSIGNTEINRRGSLGRSDHQDERTLHRASISWAETNRPQRRISIGGGMALNDVNGQRDEYAGKQPQTINHLPELKRRSSIGGRNTMRRGSLGSNCPHINRMEGHDAIGHNTMKKRTSIESNSDAGSCISNGTMVWCDRPMRRSSLGELSLAQTRMEWIDDYK